MNARLNAEDSERELEVDRREPRHPMIRPIRVRAETWGEFLQLYSRNISRGGLFVQASRVPPLDARVWVEIETPGQSGPLTLVGRVAHADALSQGADAARDRGFGVCFGEQSGEARRSLEALVTQAASALADIRMAGGGGHAAEDPEPLAAPGMTASFDFGDLTQEETPAAAEGTDSATADPEPPPSSGLLSRLFRRR